MGCDRETIGEQDGALVSALAVDDGEIVGLCFGSDDPRLERHGTKLVAITPAEELADIDLVAGFDQAELMVTHLAFASDDRGVERKFVVAINLPLAENDPEELATHAGPRGGACVRPDTGPTRCRCRRGCMRHLLQSATAACWPTL
ncbi:MAG: hypothetical protein R2710_11415 [Acidimicrobiales bacterium]